MSTRQTVKKEPEVDDDNVSMRSMSVDRSVKSMSPAVVARSRHETSSSRHSRRRSSRSPARRDGGRHTRSSRRDRNRRDHHERSSRESRTSSRRKDNKEKCRDYEGKKSGRFEILVFLFEYICNCTINLIFSLVKICLIQFLLNECQFNVLL